MAAAPCAILGSTTPPYDSIPYFPDTLSEARRYTTRSQSNPGEVYTLKRTPAGWACSCLGFYHTGCCKHLGQVERRAAREGWAFGIIAPLSRVARYFPLDLPENVAMHGAVLTVAPPVAAPVRDLDAARVRWDAALSDLYGAAAD